MITLITGAPGAGKTAALVSMLAELGKDRAIYAHGIPDLKIPHVVLDDPATWPDTVPDGAVVIIDEVQTVWRPAGPGQKPLDSIQKLETHRHRGLDFYIITQGPNLVHSNVRALVGRHVHLRDIGVLGRWWYEWPETADNCRTGWKNAPVKKRYRLPKHIFGQYKSASLHVKPVRSFPRVLVLLFAVLLVAGYLTYKTYSSISEKIKPPASPALNQAVNNPSSSVPRPASPPPPPPQQPASTTPAPLTLPQYLEARTPRLPDFLHTAPVYDELTKPVHAPYPAACVQSSTRCACYSQQGTILQLHRSVCSHIVAHGFFVDWQPKQVQPHQSPSSSPAAAPAPAPAPVQVAQAPAAPGYLESLRLRNAQVKSNFSH